MGRRRLKEKSCGGRWLRSAALVMLVLVATLTAFRACVLISPGVAAVAAELRSDKRADDDCRPAPPPPTRAVRLAVLMMMRDEEALVREHLPLWLDAAHCAVDDRTLDGSARAFAAATEGVAALESEDGSPRRFIYFYQFDGLGAARTLMIEEALAHFPEATHALFIDPDWRPLNRAAEMAVALDATARRHPAATVFVFRVADRNEATERLLDWCFELRRGVHFKYRWHEELRLAAGMDYVAAVLDPVWHVEEVAGASRQSWHHKAHGAVDDGGPRGAGGKTKTKEEEEEERPPDASARRYVFEIGLLEQDLKEDPDDPRVLYYLGVDYLALAEALVREQGESVLNEERMAQYETARRHLDRRVDVELRSYGSAYDGSARSEMTYVALLQSAKCSMRLGDVATAVRRYGDAERFDPGRVEAPLQESMMLLALGHVEAAVPAARRARNLPPTLRLFFHHAQAYACDARLHAFKAVVALMHRVPCNASLAHEAKADLATAARDCAPEKVRVVLESNMGGLSRAQLERSIDDACAAAIHPPTVLHQQERAAPEEEEASWTALEARRRGGARASGACSSAVLGATDRVARALATRAPAETNSVDDVVGALEALFDASRLQPECCVPFREFSRLFLGEDPPLVSEARLGAEGLAALDAWIAGKKNEARADGGDDDWGPVLAYARAALGAMNKMNNNHHNQSGSLAAEGPTTRALRDLMRLPPTALEGRRPPPPLATRAGPAVCEGCGVRFVAVATDPWHEGVATLRESARTAGVDDELEMLFTAEPYSGHEVKLRLLHDWVRPLAAREPGALVVFVDAYDVVLWPTAATALATRFAAFHADAVFGAESFAYPDEAVAVLYPRATRGDDDRIFLNSGTIAATAGALLKLLRAALDFGAMTLCGPDDQRTFHRLYLENPAGLKLAVDSDSTLFHTLHRELRPMHVDARGQLVVDGVGTPCISHGNAGDGKALHAKLVEARRLAVATAAEAGVGSALYSRGVELHRRGLVAEAGEAWREYVATEQCGAAHFAEANYALGVVAVANAVSGPAAALAALGYYDAALRCDPAHVGAIRNAGVTLAQAGDLGRALGYLQRAHDLEPQSHLHVETLAHVRALLRRRTTDDNAHAGRGTLADVGAAGAASAR